MILQKQVVKAKDIVLFIFFIYFNCSILQKCCIQTMGLSNAITHTKAQSVFRSPKLLIAVFVAKLSSYVEIFSPPIAFS